MADLSRTLLTMTVATALGAEMAEHLGYALHEAKGRNSGNSRNGHSTKRLMGDSGEVSPTLVSKVTDAVLEQVEAWQARPSNGLYPIVYLDNLMVKGGQDKRVINKTAHLALRLNLNGEKNMLGSWLAETERG